MGRIALIAIVAVAALIGLRTFTGGSSSSASLEGATVEGELISTISTGQQVDITAHLPSEGVVLVEFTADW